MSTASISLRGAGRTFGATRALAPTSVQEGTVRSQRLGPCQRHVGLQTERGGEPLLGQGPVA